MKKPPIPTTIDGQIKILSERGLLIDDSSKEILLQNGYYNLINGYKDPFIDIRASNDAREDRYKQGVKLIEIYQLYQFDRILQMNLFYVTTTIEKLIKSIISLHFSSQYGSSHEKYLTPKSFRYESDKDKKRVDRLIKELNNTITQYSRNKKHPAIVHYMKTYGTVPLWVLNTVLSFGKLSQFYDLLHDSMKHKIAREIHPKLTSRVLVSMLYFLTRIRNKAAHGNRLFYHKIDEKANRTSRIPQLTIHEILQIPKNPNHFYLHGQDDILAVAIIAKILLSSTNVYSLNTKRIHKSLQGATENIKSLPRNYLEDITGLKKEYLQKLEDLDIKRQV